MRQRTGMQLWRLANPLPRGPRLWWIHDSAPFRRRRFLPSRSEGNSGGGGLGWRKGKTMYDEELIRERKGTSPRLLIKNCLKVDHINFLAEASSTILETQSALDGRPRLRPSRICCRRGLWLNRYGRGMGIDSVPEGKGLLQDPQLMNKRQC